MKKLISKLTPSPALLIAIAVLLYAPALIYTISVNLIGILTFIMPVLIFSLLFYSFTSAGKSALLGIFWVLIVACVSNFAACMFAYFTTSVTPPISGMEAITSSKAAFEPLWLWHLPKLIPNSVSAMCAFVLAMGVIFAGAEKHDYICFIRHWLQTFNSAIMGFFRKSIPFLFIGALVKASHGNHQIGSYFFLMSRMIISELAYITVIYIAIAHADLRLAVRYVKNMLPAISVGFLSMSSAMALPFTIGGSTLNCGDATAARVIIPSTVSIHSIGTSIVIPGLALGIMQMQGVPLPTFAEYLVFNLNFILAKFAMCAVPGGGVIAVLPILVQTFGFTAEMGTLLIMLEAMLDCVNTCVNILGNGALCVLLAPVIKKQEV